MSEKREYTMQLLQDQSGRTASVHVTQGGKAVTPPPPEPPKPEEKALDVPVVLFDNMEQGTSYAVGIMMQYYLNNELKSDSVNYTTIGGEVEKTIGIHTIPGGATNIEFVSECETASKALVYIEGGSGLKTPMSVNGQMFPDLKSIRDTFGNGLRLDIVIGGGGTNIPTNEPK